MLNHNSLLNPEKFEVGDIVKALDDSPLPENDKAPPIVIGNEYEVLNIVLDKSGNQHLDLGLKSELNYVTSWETGEELPDGDKIHWVHPSRVTYIRYKSDKKEEQKQSVIF